MKFLGIFIGSFMAFLSISSTALAQEEWSVATKHCSPAEKYIPSNLKLKSFSIEDSKRGNSLVTLEIGDYLNCDYNDDAFNGRTSSISDEVAKHLYSFYKFNETVQQRHFYNDSGELGLRPLGNIWPRTKTMTDKSKILKMGLSTTHIITSYDIFSQKNSSTYVILLSGQNFDPIFLIVSKNGTYSLDNSNNEIRNINLQ